MGTKTHLFIFNNFKRGEREFRNRTRMLDQLSIKYHSKFVNTIVFIVEWAPEPYEMIYKFLIVNSKNEDYVLRGLRADLIIIDEYATLHRDTRNYLKVIER